MADAAASKKASPGLVRRCYRGGLCPVFILLVLTVAITGGGLSFVFFGKDIWKDEKSKTTTPPKLKTCGDLLCEQSAGENCTTCAEDCGACVPDFFSPPPAPEVLSPDAPPSAAPSPSEKEVPVLVNGQVKLDLSPRSLTQEFGNIRWIPEPEQKMTMVMRKMYDSIRWHSKAAWLYGNFTAKIQTPKGDINGIVIAWYFSSELADVSNPLSFTTDKRDEVDFEFITKQNSQYQMHYHWQSNVIVNGVGINLNEAVHATSFDLSADFHEFKLSWSPTKVEWFVDGESVRVETKYIPKKPMYMLGSMWQTDRGPSDPNRDDLINWGGRWTGTDAPYETTLKDCMVPAESV